MRLITQKRKILFVTAVVLALFCILIGKLVQLQVVQHRKMQEKRETEETRDPNAYFRVLTARRGNIYDRHGYTHPLASWNPSWKVFIDPVAIVSNVIPNEIKLARKAAYENGTPEACDESAVAEYTKREIMRLLCRFEEFDAETVVNGIVRRNTKYHPIGKTQNRDIADLISTNRILRRCVGKEDIVTRTYPLGREMSHIVGYVNSEGMPLGGIELTMNKHLTGKDGYIKGVASGVGREIAAMREEKVEPVNGCDVFLTIDQTVQHFVERALDDAMTTYNARAGWVIVQAVKTGEILAMASRPDFDPATYFDYPDADRKNLAISANYEPGSTMKALTFAAGLEEGLYTTNSLIDCSPGLYAGRPLREATRSINGPITLTTATTKSSNRAASRVAMAMGRQALETHLRTCGFGKKTGIPLPGEEAGILAPASRWSELQSIRIAIGQGISVTAMQMLNMYSALANNGVMMEPLLVKKVVDPEGRVVLENHPKPLRRIFSENTVNDLTFMLGTVTQRAAGGTGWRAAIPHYNVAGKTGTAQMVNPGGGYSETDYWVSFAGFFPVEDPHIAAIVVLEAPHPADPDIGIGGGRIAAPIFAQIGADVARHLSIPTSAELAEEAE